MRYKGQATTQSSLHILVHGIYTDHCGWDLSIEKRCSRNV